MKRATDRETIAARLTVLARALGWGGHDATITAAGVVRVHAGWVQRSAGAWSWGTTGRLSMGSQSPMRECVRAAWVVSVIVDQYAIDPVGKNDAPPAGASFGINPPWGRSAAHIKWYDAAGNLIAADATRGTVDPR